MKHLKRFENFLFEFKETEKNTPLLYKDDNLEVKVVKTPNASKEQGKNTNWCSNSDIGFHRHNMTSNMYRFNFKDGYKLRLTWDYITRDASHLGSYSGGTHWGQGGIVNGEKQWYDVFRPELEDEPFLIDWKKEEKREIVERILSIPESAQEKVKEYQASCTREKSGIISSGYNEVAKIKIKDVGESKVMDRELTLPITVEYLGRKYSIKFKYSEYSKYFDGTMDIPLKQKHVGSIVMNRYLYDKLMEFLKSNGRRDIIDTIKSIDKSGGKIREVDIWDYIEEVLSEEDFEAISSGVRGTTKVNIEKILKKYKDKLIKYDISDIIELVKASSL